MKLPAISGFDLVKTLVKEGFIIKRRRGSHVSLEKGAGEDLVRITVPLHQQLKKGTLRQIMHDAKIPLERILR